MDPILKQKWCNALRSGKYKQGTGVLRDCDDKYCCLGVLCDIWDSKSWKISDDGKYYNYGEDGPYGFLPDHIGESNKVNLNRSTIWQLVDLNDRDKKSFAEIAEYIENNKEI